MTTVKHFVLVHGSSHGAWCWYKLIPLLKSAGHRVTALDLGASGIHSKCIEELTSFYDYLQPLMEFMASLSQHDKVILVGHSYGGLALSLAMEKFSDKITVAVFVSAYLPKPLVPPVTLVQEFFRRASAESLLDCEISFQDDLPISVVFGSKYLKTIMYQNCPLEDMELAKTLLRPFKFFLEDFGKESLLSEEKYGKVKKVFVVCKQDEVMREEFAEWMINNSPPDEVEVIHGAGHMVMLSKPKDLCNCFLEIANKY